ncbi:PREDICTED: carbonic anhydrase 2 [Ceratosolen solmsi marchali]|uniref:Carbonic anhydrase 2 n=1 Tax=Ceratosolen solmsi marchali TaxID=326594 RepID=A0AAJ7E2H4_9HYME|nr:PREDICTED: carbonic anhydrase 2 [Ceratosolen solmsi marchali]
MINLVIHFNGANLNFHSICPVVLFAFFFDTIDVTVLEHVNFGYSGSHGPDHWAENYDTCVGKHQSPINIQEHDVRDINLPLLIFSGLDTPRKFFLINNGHTALLYSSKDNKQFYMSGGPLNGIYVFEQLHFHWGENDREGSEDLINNHSFAMELHAVFYKDKYGSMNDAIHNPDGLAVIAFFFEAEVNDRANPLFDTIVEALPKIEKVGTEIQLSENMHLGHLLNPAGPPSDRMQNYFTYNGSLTTPPCSEVVTWIDFKYPLYLSHLQIAAFRNIRGFEGHKLTHNFRPVQPLSDRRVLHNLPNKKFNTKSEAIQISPSHHVLPFLSLICLAYLFL